MAAALPSRRSVALGALALPLAGCGDFPRDPERTLEHIRARGRLRAGLVAGEDLRSPWGPLLQRLCARTGSRPELHAGHLEPLLLHLEHGALDLVLGGRFARDTGWKTRVALGKPLRASSGHPDVTAHAASRNGENAWIMLIEREARAGGLLAG